MQIQCWSPGGVEGCGHFSRDESALAHAGYNYPSRTAIQHFNGTLEVTRHGPGDTVGEGAQRFGFDTHNVFSDFLHERENASFRPIDFIAPASATPLRGS